MTNDIIQYTPDQVTLIKNIAAPKCTDDEFKLLLYQAKTYQLDPLLRQIWAVKYTDNRPASIFAGRDGFLAIAHRSRQFNGIESDAIHDETGKLIGAWAKVYRKDAAFPFFAKVKFSEYDRSGKTRGTQSNNWDTMPETMIVKVAEVQALRKAFSITGIYSPDEMPEPEKPPMKDITPAEPERKKGGRPPVHDLSKAGKLQDIIDAEEAQRK